MAVIFCRAGPVFIEYISVPGLGSRWMFTSSFAVRMPAVRRFWVIVANLPPPVPRKVSVVGSGIG